MTEPDILLIDCEQPESGANDMTRRPEFGARIATVPLYDLDRAPLERFRTLMVPMHVDQRFLATRRERLDAFVASGGTVLIGGHVAYPFLAGTAPFVPLTDYRLEDLVVAPAVPHPIWDGIDFQDLTFRRGVAGFYAGGHHPPPPGATVINTIGPARLPVDILWRHGGGRVLLHGGNDLWTYSGTGTSADRLLPQLFRWLAEAAVPA
jgi:hypothetical protein